MVLSAVVILFVGAFAFENNVASDAVFNYETELRLVKHVLLRSEVY